MTRVYAGTTLAELGAWRASGEIPVGTRVRVVSEEVAAALPDSGDEEREYVVTMLAAADSLDRLIGTGGEQRVVVVAERAAVQPGDEPALARLDAALPWRDVVALLVEEGGGGPAPDLSEDPELAWYTPAELDSLSGRDASPDL